LSFKQISYRLPKNSLKSPNLNGDFSKGVDPVYYKYGSFFYSLSKNSSDEVKNFPFPDSLNIKDYEFYEYGGTTRLLEISGDDDLESATAHLQRTLFYDIPSFKRNSLFFDRSKNDSLFANAFLNDATEQAYLDSYVVLANKDSIFAKPLNIKGKKGSAMVEKLNILTEITDIIPTQRNSFIIRGHKNNQIWVVACDIVKSKRSNQDSIKIITDGHFWRYPLAENGYLAVDNEKNVLYLGEDTLKVPKSLLNEISMPSLLYIPFDESFKSANSGVFIAESFYTQKEFSSIFIVDRFKNLKNIENWYIPHMGYYYINGLIIVNDNSTSSTLLYDAAAGGKVNHTDSVVSQWVTSRSVETDHINYSGYLALPFEDDHIFIRRHLDGNYTAAVSKAEINSLTLFNHLEYTITYDVYFIVIFTCIVVIIYFFLLIVITTSQINVGFDFSAIPKFNEYALDYKSYNIYHTMDSLKKRSEWMLRLGIFFGVFGVFVSALIFKTSNLEITNNWKDPHTYISLLKPFIILLFIETFTFYFLKQYRIIFNEYKLFYGLFLNNLNYNILYSLKNLKDYKDQPEIMEIFKTKITAENNVLYEQGTKTTIDEFQHQSILDVIEKVKKEG
jgi:hypothetical protein